MGGGMATVGVGVGIDSRAGIGASFSKDIFGPFRVPFLLYGVSSVVYSRGVGE